MYTSTMKNTKNNEKPATVRDVSRIVKKIVTNSEEKLALMMGKAFAEVHDKFSGLKTELNVKIDGLTTKVDAFDVKLTGTNIRIDDLAMNRVKFDDFQVLVQRVDKLERKRGKKGYNR
jgi:hypothetical protein